MSTLSDLTQTLILGTIGDPDSANQVIDALQASGTSSVNGITGDIAIVAGSNVTVTPSGQNITISSTGGGGSLPSPLEALETYTPNATGEPAAFIGINSSISAPPIVYFGSTDQSTDATTYEVFLIAGDITFAGASGNAGSIVIDAGNIAGSGANTGNAGSVSINAGNISSGSGAAGSVSLQAGAGDSAVGGNVAISAGNTNTAPGGYVVIAPGSGTPAGYIQFTNSGERTAGQVWTSVDTNGSGQWLPASALPAPLEALAIYTADSIGAPGTFLGNASDNDQTNLLITLGSTDTAVISNSTSAVYLISGDCTNAASSGNTGNVTLQSGNIIAGSGSAGSVNVIAGEIISGAGNAGSVDMSSGNSDSGSAGNFTANSGSSNSGTPGIISFLSGSSTSNANPGGDINLTTGTGSNSGNINLQCANVSGGATGGTVTINAGNSGTGTGGQVQINAGSSGAMTGAELTITSAVAIISDSNFQLFSKSGTTPQSLQFFEQTGSHFVSFQASPSLATSTSWILPRSDGAAGQPIVTDGAGNLSFADSASGTITAAASSLLVTDARVTTTSKVFVVLQSNDSTAILKNVIPGSGSFTINLGAAATANTNFSYIVF